MESADDAPNLCPLDERRTETEVFVKRMAVMVAVLCLLGHLNARRAIASPRYLPRSAVLVFLAIFNPLYPALTLVFDGLWALARAYADGRRRAALGGRGAAAGDLGFYLAAAAGAHASHQSAAGLGDDGPVADSTALLHLPPDAVRAERRRRPAGINRLGGLLVLVAGLVQCGTTAYLGFRREAREAASPLDRRQYLFALSGLAVTAQTLLLRAMGSRYAVVDERPERTSGPTWAYERLSNAMILAEIMLYIVSLCFASYYAGDGVNETGLIAVAWFGAVMLLWPWHLLFQDDSLLPQMKETLVDDLLPTLKRLATIRRGFEAQKKVLAEAWEHITMVAMMVGILLMHIIPLLFGACAAYFFFLITYAPESDHFADDQGNPLPTDIPCPELWKDPMADLLWAF